MCMCVYIPPSYLNHISNVMLIFLVSSFFLSLLYLNLFLLIDSYTYNLPSTIDLLSTEISKETWKQTVDKHVSAYWVDKIKLEASEKSSLKFLNIKHYKIGEVHYLWKNAGFNLMAIMKAGFKAKVMTGTYVL